MGSDARWSSPRSWATRARDRGRTSTAKTSSGSLTNADRGRARSQAVTRRPRGAQDVRHEALRAPESSSSDPVAAVLFGRNEESGPDSTT